MTGRLTVSDLTRQQAARALARDGLVMQLGPFVMRLGTDLPELVEPWRLLYAHHPLLEDAAIIDIDVRVDRVRSWRRWKSQARFLVEGRPTFDPFERHLALPMSGWIINWCVFTWPNDRMILHAGVLERDGCALILPGSPGAGKSTLTTGLMHRGWRLLSDEVALIDLGQTQVRGAPLPVGLKEGAIDVVRREVSEAVIGPAVDGTRKGRVAHVQPPAEAVERMDQRCDSRWVVFPRFEAGCEPAMRQVLRSDALLRIASDAFNFSLLGLPAFQTLSQVVQQCACYEIRYPSLDQACSMIHAITSGSGLADQASTGQATNDRVSTERSATDRALGCDDDQLPHRRGDS